MKKSINTILSISILLVILSIVIFGTSQWYLSQNISSPQETRNERQEFVNTTNNIENLKQAATLLLESEQNNYEFINNLIESIRQY